MPSIIATAWEARALAQGRLSAFVRPVVPATLLSGDIADAVLPDGRGGWVSWFSSKADTPGFIEQARELSLSGKPGFNSPFGRVGDVLAVRETWRRIPRTAYGSSEPFRGPIDPNDPDMAAVYKAGFDRSMGGISWRSGATMPAWAARWHLLVVSIGVKRVGDLTHRDCADGGAKDPRHHHDDGVRYIEDFQHLYDSHWAKRGYHWSDNPCVWVARVGQAEGDGK